MRRSLEQNPMSKGTSTLILKRLRDMGVYKPSISSSNNGDSILIESYPLEARILASVDPNEGPIHTYRIVNVHGGDTITSGVVTIGQDLVQRVGQVLVDFHEPAFREAKEKEADVMRRLREQNPHSAQDWEQTISTGDWFDSGVVAGQSSRWDSAEQAWESRKSHRGAPPEYAMEARQQFIRGFDAGRGKVYRNPEGGHWSGPFEPGDIRAGDVVEYSPFGSETFQSLVVGHPTEDTITTKLHYAVPVLKVSRMWSKAAYRRIFGKPPEGPIGRASNPEGGEGDTWPDGFLKVPSPKFPGEMTKACPKCGSTNWTMTVAPSGVGSGPGGRWRLGDAADNVTICNNCGYRAWTPGKRNPSTRDLEDVAFGAGKEWGQTGSWDAGVSNERAKGRRNPELSYLDIYNMGVAAGERYKSEGHGPPPERLILSMWTEAGEPGSDIKFPGNVDGFAAFGEGFLEGYLSKGYVTRNPDVLGGINGPTLKQAKEAGRIYAENYLRNTPDAAKYGAVPGSIITDLYDSYKRRITTYYMDAIKVAKVRQAFTRAADTVMKTASYPSARNPESSIPAIYSQSVTIGGRRRTIDQHGTTYREKANILKKLFPEHASDKSWHKEQARRFMGIKNQAVQEHSRLFESAFEQTHGRKPGTGDFRISGIGDDKLPGDVKDRLRDLSKLSAQAGEIAHAHATAAGAGYQASGHYLGEDRMSNPESSAADLYESFHGKPSEEILEIGEEIHYHENLAGLGVLTEIKVDCFSGYSAVLKFDRETQLCSNEEGTQLYIIGGDQSLNLGSLKFKDAEIAKEQVAIGVITEITYNTQKGFHNFKPTDYYHELGEESGYQPILTYDTRNQQLTIAGGAYRIKPEGIVD